MIRLQRIGYPIIMLTAKGQEEDIIRAWNLGPTISNQAV